MGPVGTLVWKDIVMELRAREMLFSLLLFAFMILVIFSFAFNPAEHDLGPIFAGIMWIAFFFGGSLGLNRSFAVERYNAAFQGLLLTPVDRSTLFLGKFLSNALFMLGTETLLTPLFFVFLGEPWRGSLPLLAAALVLGTVGFTAVGTFVSVLAGGTRASEVLLPLLLFPLLAPVIIASVRATEAALAADGAGALAGFAFLGAYDVMFVALPFVLFDYLFEG